MKVLAYGYPYHYHRGSYLHIGAVHELTSERLAHFTMWLDDIPFLDDPPFIHNDLYGHETTAKLKLDNIPFQQYIICGGGWCNSWSVSEA